MRGLFTMLAALLTAAAVVFLVFPVAAILIRVPPGDIWFSDPALDALRVSVRTNVIANAVILVVGTPVAYLLATRRFPGHGLLVTLITLPLVLPPAVAGIGLLVALGRAGVIGDQVTALGLSIPFTQTAVVLAVVFVAGPVYLRGASAAFAAVDAAHREAARTLGAGPARVFRRIALPLASGGLTASWAMAFARGVGEFGATIIVAGSLQGTTQTLPLAVYAQFAQDFDTALAVGGLQIAFAACVLAVVTFAATTRSWTRPFWTYGWRSPAAGSASTSRSR